MLRNGIGRICRNAKHVNFSERVFHVNVVKARTAERNELNAHLAKAVYNRGIHGVVYENANTVKAVRKLNRILVKLCLKILD